jgi:uroporphyrin-3 C-methyltransferase
MTDQTQADQTPATPEAQAASPPPPPPRKKRSRFGFFMAFFLLLLLAAASAASYFLWQQLELQRTQLQAEIADVAPQLQALNQELETLQQRMQNDFAGQVTALQSQYTNLERSLRELYARQRTSANEEDWNIAEVVHLLNIANQRLLLAQDVTSAIAALQAADKSLRQNTDPRVLPVREQLAKDLKMLREAPQPDITGMTLTLSNHSRSVDDLPLQQGYQEQALNTDAQTAREETPAPPIPVTDWRAWLSKIWREMEQLVVIRRNNSDEVGLLAPEQRYFLNANLRLYLESARFYLLRRDTTQFHDTLATIQNWLDKYYDDSAPSIQTLKQDLQHMQKENLTVPAANLDATLKALQQLSDERLKAASQLPTDAEQ